MDFVSNSTSEAKQGGGRTFRMLGKITEFDLSARGLEPAGKIAGTASSVMGFVQTLLSASGAFVAAALFDGTHRSLCWVMGSAAIIIFVLWWKGRRYL